MSSLTLMSLKFHGPYRSLDSTGRQCTEQSQRVQARPGLGVTSPLPQVLPRVSERRQ